MRFYSHGFLPALLTCIFIVGCSNNGNPVQFSKIEQKRSASVLSSVEENTPPKYTLLELYLMEKIEREYIMSWFFSEDVEQYRARLFYIKSEIHSKMPLSLHDQNRVLLLEAGMNDLIRIFNDRSLLTRSKEVLAAVFEKYKYEFVFPNREKINPTYTLDEIENQGMPAQAISNHFMGFVASMMKYGFKIEPVNFLDR